MADIDAIKHKQYSRWVIQAPTGTPRSRRHDEQLRRILDAAMAMVERGGLEALSINQLAHAVDYTPGALYRYFASKEELLSRLVQRIVEDIGRYLARALAAIPEKAAPLVRILGLVGGYRAFAREEPQRFGLVAVTLADARVLLAKQDAGQPVAFGVLAALQPIAKTIEAASSAGRLSPGDGAERAVILFALVHGLLQTQKLSRYAPALIDASRLVDAGIRSLLLGWGGSARVVDSAFEQLRRLDARPPR